MRWGRKLAKEMAGEEAAGQAAAEVVVGSAPRPFCYSLPLGDVDRAQLAKVVAPLPAALLGLALTGQAAGAK